MLVSSGGCLVVKKFGGDPGNDMLVIYVVVLSEGSIGIPDMMVWMNWINWL